MNSPSSPAEITGVLHIAGGEQSQNSALAIKAVLEDLPGVHAVETVGYIAQIRFDAALITEQQLYQAVSLAGFQSASFAALAVH